jgi:hypothetical protein
MEFSGIYTVCLHTKSYVLSHKDLLAITNKWKEKYRFHLPAMLFMTLQKITLTKVACFLEIYYLTKFQVPTLSGTISTIT